MRRQANTKHQLMCQPDKAPRTWVPQTRKPTWTAMWLPLPRSPHCPPPPGWAPLEPRSPWGPSTLRNHTRLRLRRGEWQGRGHVFWGFHWESTWDLLPTIMQYGSLVWFPCMHGFSLACSSRRSTNLLDIAEARAPKRGKPAIIYSNIMYTVYISVYV